MQKCVLIAEGDLGIKELRIFNKALTRKWIWRFGLESVAQTKDVEKEVWVREKVMIEG